MVAAHEAGLDVARLHSGDPSVFSALAEQMRRLDAAGVPYDVCPGVPAFAAAAAALRRELTVPTVAQTVILTRISALATPMPTARTWPRWAAPAARWCCTWRCTGSTRSSRQLSAVYGPDCPAAVVAHASRAARDRAARPLDVAARAVHEAGIRRAAV